MFEQTKTARLLALWPFAYVPWSLSKPATCSFGCRFASFGERQEELERKMERGVAVGRNHWPVLSGSLQDNVNEVLHALLMQSFCLLGHQR